MSLPSPVIAAGPRLQGYTSALQWLHDANVRRTEWDEVRSASLLPRALTGHAHSPLASTSCQVLCVIIQPAALTSCSSKLHNLLGLCSFAGDVAWAYLLPKQCWWGRTLSLSSVGIAAITLSWR